MPYCIAKYCHVSYENNPNNAHFHRLPKRCALRRQWLAKCARPARQDKQARVCSLHFKKDDYDNFLQYDSGFASKLILKPDAVPSVFGEPDVPVEEGASSAGPSHSERTRRLERRSTKQVIVARTSVRVNFIISLWTLIIIASVGYFFQSVQTDI